MKLSIATIFISLCGAVFAVPTHGQRDEKRSLPFLFPGEDSELGPEPTLPISSYPFQSESGGLTQSTGLPWFPPIQSMGAGEESEESPLDKLSELREKLPWGQFGGLGGLMMEDNESVLGEEDI